MSRGPEHPWGIGVEGMQGGWEDDKVSCSLCGARLARSSRLGQYTAFPHSCTRFSVRQKPALKKIMIRNKSFLLRLQDSEHDEKGHKTLMGAVVAWSLLCL